MKTLIYVDMVAFSLFEQFASPSQRLKWQSRGYDKYENRLCLNIKNFIIVKKYKTTTGKIKIINE